jgi:hypothetical protein
VHRDELARARAQCAAVFAAHCLMQTMRRR